MAKVRVIGISGSLRQGSFNSALLTAATGLMPHDSELVAATIHGIPLYDGDLEETSGVPDVVQALKERIAGAAGVLLVTPEYNNSIPGVFKNAIDWTTRPSSDMARVWGGKPVGMIGATPGPWGTALAQAAWLPVLRTLGTLPFFGARLQVPNAAGVFDEHGALSDAKVRSQLTKYMVAFVQFVTRQSG